MNRTVLLHLREGGSPLLLLQVARFDDRGHKLQVPIQPPYDVRFPHFSSYDCSVAWSAYTTRAVAFHLGDTTTSGHYRAALVQGSSIRYLTDDHSVASEPSEPVISTAQANSYVFFLSLQERSA